MVAHFHYVLFGGSVFAIIGGLWYWWPKMFGRMLSERLGKWSFVFFFVGFNLTFFPQHMLGLMGMPRRIYTYENTDWEGYNLTSTIGSYVMAAGVLLRSSSPSGAGGRAAARGTTPGSPDTLEWYTTSPRAMHNFDTVPYVTSARQLNDLHGSD